jgi:hypothetical protein
MAQILYYRFRRAPLWLPRYNLIIASASPPPPPPPPPPAFAGANTKSLYYVNRHKQHRHRQPNLPIAPSAPIQPFGGANTRTLYYVNRHKQHRPPPRRDIFPSAAPVGQLFGGANTKLVYYVNRHRQHRGLTPARLVLRRASPSVIGRFLAMMGVGA